MNNFYNYQDNLDTYKYKPNNSAINDLVTPYEGFIRGNMFKSLYEPYKNITPYQIRPMNKQAEMLTSIDALTFALLDMNLYLDIYPKDTEVINLYTHYNTQNKQLKEEYENMYGPLTTSSSATSKTPWSWDDKPWPWDNI